MRSMMLAALAGLAFAQDDDLASNSYRGKTPPEPAIARDHWINSKDGLTLEKLKGRVVWLEFSFLA